jgi:hypothetical protein
MNVQLKRNVFPAHRYIEQMRGRNCILQSREVEWRKEFTDEISKNNIHKELLKRMSSYSHTFQWGESYSKKWKVQVYNSWWVVPVKCQELSLFL